MGLYRRNGSKVWHADITAPDGTRHRVSTKVENKQLAKIFHDKLKEDLWKEAALGIKRGRSFAEAVEVFLCDKRHKKSIETDRIRLAHWLKEFRGLNLQAIDQDRILETIKKREGLVAPATRNRELSALRTLLRYVMKKYRWLAAVPQFFFYPEPPGRVRWLTPEEIERLLVALPKHLRPLAAFSLATGLRKANARGLRWRQVDLERKIVVIEGEAMKNGDHQGIPLSDLAVEVLRQQDGKHDDFVFTYRGRPLKAIANKTWKDAVARAGITDFRWHDMRHTWATMMTQAGVPEAVLQVLGAWKTAAMVKRYAHHSAGSLRPHTLPVDQAMQKVAAQLRHTGGTEEGSEASEKAPQVLAST